MAGFGRIATSILFILLATGLGASQQTRDFKLAVVHIQEVVESSPGFKRASEQWSLTLADITAQIQVLQIELREAQLLLSGDAAPLGEARAALLTRIERLQIDVERMSTDTQEELNALRQSLMEPVVESVNVLVQSYSEENGFDLVLDTSNPDFGMTLASQDVDLTETLLQILREADQEAPSPPIASPDSTQ